MKATLEIGFESSSIARKALNSLKQEASFKKRSNAHIKIEGRKLLISIEAEEFPALRATLSSYLRLLSVVFSLLNLTKKEV